VTTHLFQDFPQCRTVRFVALLVGCERKGRPGLSIGLEVRTLSPKVSPRPTRNAVSLISPDMKDDGGEPIDPSRRYHRMDMNSKGDIVAPVGSDR